MKITKEISIEEFEGWSGGRDTLDVLIEKDLCDQLEAMLENDIFPDGCTDTELNDLLWFERDTIAEWLGFSDWEALENGEGDEEEVEVEEEENNFSRWCDNQSYNCSGCPYQKLSKLSDCEAAYYHDHPDDDDGIRLYK